jgi:hypothetical protein
MKHHQREQPRFSGTFQFSSARRQLLLAGAVVPVAFALGVRPSRAAALRSAAESTDNAPLRTLLGDDGIRILTYASLAPSGHNTQPWAVYVLDRAHWRIGTRREHWLPAVDPGNRETVLSIGAFLENLIVAAGNLGFAVEYEVVATTSFESPLIDLRLRKARPGEYPLSRLQLRRTLRKGYGSQPLRAEDVRKITGGASDFRYFPRDSRAAQFLSEATIEANHVQAYRDPAQEELAEWIRWSKDDQLRLRNGLTPAGMEIDGILGWYVGTFYDRTDVLTPGFREAGIRQVVERVSQGAGWLVMTGPDSVAGLIETGRRFQRMWLLLREHSIAIHPMTQVLEESPDTRTVARELGVDGVPQFVLRIGYVTRYPDPVSPRMPVTWFTQQG